MADGSDKPIEKVSAGDGVLSYDMESGALVAGLVERVVAHGPSDNESGLLRINDRLVVTPEHLFFVDGAWRPAGHLRIGDSLLQARSDAASSGRSLASVQVERIEVLPGGVATYNFEVARYHTYFAGGVLVHNIKANGAVAPAPASSQPTTAPAGY